jgi:hypothetical protein
MQLCHRYQELLRNHLEVKRVISNLRELRGQDSLQVFDGVTFQELMHHSCKDSQVLLDESLKDRNQNDHRLA